MKVTDIKPKIDSILDNKPKINVLNVKPTGMKITQENEVYYESSLLSQSMPSGLLMAITYPETIGTVQHIRD